jgi:hypothetical protein
VTDRWSPELVAERWGAFTADEREALMRFGHRQAPWEAVPDTACRLLLADPKVSLEGVRIIDAIFRAAYAEMVTL